MNIDPMLAWLLGYLAVCILIAAAGLALVRLEEKKAIKRHEEAISQGNAPWCLCLPPKRMPPIPPHNFLLFSVLLIPGLICVAVSAFLMFWKAERRVAWERSPEGQASLESRHQQMIEEAIVPWVPEEWITEWNIPWAEFEADYRDSINWAPLSRDAFALLWSRVSDADEIGYFNTPPETWTHLRGRAGWVVLREGKVVGQLTTAMN